MAGIHCGLQRCEVVESEQGRCIYGICLQMASYGAIEFERVGIMTDFEYTDDLFGEDNSTLAANYAADTYAE